MDVSDLARRLLRRRLAVVLVLVLAVAAGAYSYKRATPTLQTTAAVVIVPPAAATVANPLLQLDSNLAQLATVLATAMQSSTVGDALAKRNANGTFTVSTVTGDNPSFAQLSAQLQFTVSSTTAADARRTASALVTEARAQLSSIQRQAGVAQAARATLVESVAPGTPTSAGNSALRAAGSIFLAIIVLGLLAVLLGDQLATRRSARKGRKGRKGRDDTGTDGPDPAPVAVDPVTAAPVTAEPVAAPVVAAPVVAAPAVAEPDVVAEPEPDADADADETVSDQDAPDDADEPAPSPESLSDAPEAVEPETGAEPAPAVNGFHHEVHVETETDVELGPELELDAELGLAPDPAAPVAEPVAGDPAAGSTEEQEPTVEHEPAGTPAADPPDPELELPPDLEPEDEPHLFDPGTPEVFDPAPPEPGPSPVAVLVASRVAARSSTALRSR